MHICGNMNLCDFSCNAKDTFHETSGDKSTNFAITEENPYEDMFRVSINACKKCKGNGIIIPKGKNEPIICPKCEGHGYANDDVIYSGSINACGRCLIM